MPSHTILTANLLATVIEMVVVIIGVTRVGQILGQMDARILHFRAGIALRKIQKTTGDDHEDQIDLKTRNGDVNG